MISAIDNAKNQYYEKVGAVQFQTSRGYPPEFYDQMNKKIGSRSDTFERRDENKIASQNFGSLLTYGRSNSNRANPFAQQTNDEYTPLHPNIKDENKAQVFDLLA